MLHFQMTFSLPSTSCLLLKLPNKESGTATTTPLINDLISLMKKNNRAARAARFLEQALDICKMTTRNFRIWGSDDNASSQQ